MESLTNANVGKEAEQLEPHILLMEFLNSGLGERNQSSDGPAGFQGVDDVLCFIREVITIDNKSRGHPSPSIAAKSFSYDENF